MRAQTELVPRRSRGADRPRPRLRILLLNKIPCHPEVSGKPRTAARPRRGSQRVHRARLRGPGDQRRVATGVSSVTAAFERGQAPLGLGGKDPPDTKVPIYSRPALLPSRALRMAVTGAAPSASTAPWGAGAAHCSPNTQRNAYDSLSLQVNLAVRIVPPGGY